MLRKSISGLVLPALLASVLAGCERKEPRVYLVPKDTAAQDEPADTEAESASNTAPPPGAPANPHATEPAAPDTERPPLPTLSGVLPSGWKDLGAEGMNAAKFQAGDATVSATPLPSFAGKEAVAVNLWRTAMGQTPLEDAAAVAMLSDLPIAGGKGKLFDLTGERTDDTGKKIPTRIVTALLNREGATWFFKLQGPPEAVAPQVGPFKEFLTTVQFEEPKSDPPKAPVPGAPPPSDTPKSTPPSPPSTPAPSAPVASTPAAPNPPPAPTALAAPTAPPSLPTGWASLQPGPMQAAKFSVPDKDGAKAEVSVSIFPSDTGGTLANVRRWRGQIGLPDADDATVQANAKPLDGGPAGSLLVTLENGDKSFVGAIVPRGGEWYFYKLVGGAPAVASARESFIVFARAQ